MSQAGAQAPLDVELALRNIVRQLQAEPQRYRLFGLWWWRVKPLLAARFDRNELPILGDYVDAEQRALVDDTVTPEWTDEHVVATALQEYGFNARFGRPDGKVEWGSEVLTLYDPDIEA